VRWSVGLEAQCDREMLLEEIVELADAVAYHSGVATGIGSTRYGAQIVVAGETEEEAIKEATEVFERCVVTAGLPICPIVRVEAVSEEQDAMEDDE
jgi:DhnA family fructose-bisphosphate aldolase class Ia